MKHNQTFSGPINNQLLVSPRRQAVPLVLTSPRAVEESRATLLAGSRDKVSSSHRIERKKSPTKINLVSTHGPFTHALNPNTSLCSESGANSIVRKQVVGQSPLGDRSNVVLPVQGQKPHLLRFNYVTTSPRGRDSSSIHVRQHLVHSPGKVVSKASGREVELDRKVRVLEKRVGELHHEKHALMGKMNEENRRVYHQNTTLRLEIAHLTKIIEGQKGASMNASVSEETDELQGVETSIQEQPSQGALNEQISELEGLLQAEIDKNLTIMEKYSELESIRQEEQTTLDKVTQERDKYQHSLLEVTQQLEALTSKAAKLQEQSDKYEELVSTRESELKAIQTLMEDNNERNGQVIEEYEAKLQEYANAYTHNQKVIEELTEQLIVIQNQKEVEDKILEAVEEEEEAERVQVQEECSQMEDQLRVTLEEREQAIREYQVRILQLEELLNEKEQFCSEVALQNEEQAEKLSEVAENLHNVSQRYEELQAKYQEALLSADRPQSNRSVGEKCRKCDELMKTIIRLNMHLNSKKAQ